MKNGIYLIATPIGNIADITLRAIDVLKSANVIACEDTRVTKKLLTLLNLPLKDKKFIPLHDHNEADTLQKVLDEAISGSAVAYMSDAGSPLISDPGYKLAKAAKEQNVYLTTIPGACAAICALQLSGLPSNTFMFCGFIPNKDKARTDFFTHNKNIGATLIFYERADRLVKSLEVAYTVFGSRPMAVAREITKLHEECRNGTAVELAQYYTENPPKGEIVLLVAPSIQNNGHIEYEEDLITELKQKNLKMAVKNIVERYGLSRNEVYQRALELKNNE